MKSILARDVQFFFPHSHSFTKDTDAHDEMSKKQPSAEPLFARAVNHPLAQEPLEDEAKATLAKAVSHKNWRRQHRQYMQMSHFIGGSRTREHIAPLLHIPASAGLIVSKIVQPFRAGHIPPVHVEMHSGRILMTPGKDPKSGSRPISCCWVCSASIISLLTDKVKRPHLAE